MRNAVIGAVLAVLFIGGLFAAMHFGGTHALRGAANSGKSSSPALPPAEAAAQIKANFIGSAKIGDWVLQCGKPRKLPAPPGNPSKPGGLPAGMPTPPPNSPLKRLGAPSSKDSASGPQTASTSSDDEKLRHPSPDFMIPRCHTSIYLPVPGDPKQTFRVNFRLFGFRRLLAVFMQVPQETNPGSVIEMETSTKTIPVPVRGCNPVKCLVAESFKIKDTPPIMTTKKLAFIFPPDEKGRPRIVKTSAYGLPEVLATIRRIDK